MQNVTLIGIDLGKPSFHIHCQDKCGKTMLRKKIYPHKINGIFSWLYIHYRRDGSVCGCTFYGSPDR